jgi:hypothetical protein
MITQGDMAIEQGVQLTTLRLKINELDKHVAVLQAALCGVPLPYETELPGITEALKYKPQHQALIYR